MFAKTVFIVVNAAVWSECSGGSELMVSLPWDWTNLPALLRTQKDDISDDELVTLLSPLALQDLIRWIRQWRQPRVGATKMSSNICKNEKF